MPNSNKIIATGITGLVGTRVVELNPDYQFINASLDVGIDITDINSIEKIFIDNPDSQIVLHMAAFTDTNSAWNERGDETGNCYKINVLGTQNISDLCRKYGKYLIYISTDFVFDGTKSGQYEETDIPNPIEWYGQTKYFGEQYIATSGVKNSIVRIAFPYRTDFPQKTDIIRKIIDKLKNNEKLFMFTDQITTPTFIDDIAIGLKLFFDNQYTGIYHLVGSSSQSPYDMAIMIALHFNFDASLVTPTKLSEFIVNQPIGSRPWQQNLSLSNQKIKSLGLTPKTLEQGLQSFPPRG